MANMAGEIMDPFGTDHLSIPVSWDFPRGTEGCGNETTLEKTFWIHHPLQVLHPPYLGKVIERMVAEQLQVFLNDTSLLDPFLSGFQSGYRSDNTGCPHR